MVLWGGLLKELQEEIDNGIAMFLVISDNVLRLAMKTLQDVESLKMVG